MWIALFLIDSVITQKIRPVMWILNFIVNWKMISLRNYYFCSWHLILVKLLSELSQALWSFYGLINKIISIFQVNRYAFSSGQDSIELHRKLGANLDVNPLPNLVVIVNQYEISAQGISFPSLELWTIFHFKFLHFKGCEILSFE
jgi:hypothetical protein